jgi:hypothetical protein
MASRIEETSAQLDPTDELPALKADVLRGIGVASAPADSAPDDQLDESVEALREALQTAESRWQRLEARVAAQDEAIAQLRRALDPLTDASEPQTDIDTPRTAAADLETDATVEFRFVIDTNEDDDDAVVLAEDLDFEAQAEADAAESAGALDPAAEAEPAAGMEAAGPGASDGEPTTRVPELTDIVAAERLAMGEAEAATEPAAEAAETEAPRAAEPVEMTAPTAASTELCEAELNEAGLSGLGPVSVGVTGAMPDVEAGIDSELAGIEPAATDQGASPSGKEQALLERVAELEAYVNGRAEQWLAMEQALRDQETKLAELECELEQRIKREQNLEQRLLDEGAKAQALQERLRRDRLDTDEPAESPAARPEGT